MTLLEQSLARKVDLARALRSQLQQYVPWIGGEVLARLAEAIAVLEQEITDLADSSEGFDAIATHMNRCPMQHECPGMDCKHRQLCREAAEQVQTGVV